MEKRPPPAAGGRLPSIAGGSQHQSTQTGTEEVSAKYQKTRSLLKELVGLDDFYGVIAGHPDLLKNITEFLADG